MIDHRLYYYRTISDTEEWDKACDDFEYDDTAVFPWPEPTNEKWYERADEEIPDMDELDLPEQIQVMVNVTKEQSEEDRKFKAFMWPCCEMIIRETKLCLKYNASFDLSVLSGEGFIAVHRSITCWLRSLLKICMLLWQIYKRDLHTAVAGVLKNDCTYGQSNR